MADKKTVDTTHDDSAGLSSTVPYALDYKPKLLSASRPVYQPATFLNGANQVTLLAAGVSQIVANIPRGPCYDFSKSFLRFDMDFAVPGAGTRFTKVWMHKPPIQSLYLRSTASGQVLVGIEDFPYYWLMTRCAVSRDEFLRNGTSERPENRPHEDSVRNRTDRKGIP